MWIKSTKWVFRVKPNEMYSTERKLSKGINKDKWDFQLKPKLKWIKSGFTIYSLFIMLALIGMFSFFAIMNESDELKEKHAEKEQYEANEDDKTFVYLLKNAEYYYLKSDFETAKKELEIALKTYPKNADANRLYVQTMIQLVDKYPSYKEKAYQLTKEKITYLTDSEEDQQITQVYRNLFAEISD